MTFRGYFALDGVEFANSSRVSAHLGRSTPTQDIEAFGRPETGLTEVSRGLFAVPSECQESLTGGLFTPPTGAQLVSPGLNVVNNNCGLTEVSRGLFAIPSESIEVSDGLFTPPYGSRRVSPGLIAVDGRCAEASKLCGCRLDVEVDDSWIGLQYFLGHPAYHPELAPWYIEQFPESAEFGGVWVVKVDGLDTIPVSRQITEMAGSGAVAGIHRDTSRTIMFEAVLVACTSAGLQYGLGWLNCQLRASTDMDGSTLTFLASHPGNSAVDPAKLWRESRNVVLTKAPTITESTGGGRPNQQATIYRVNWEMTACSPYTYMPALEVPVQWDSVTSQPVNWVHDAGCERPESCASMPVLFSADCAPEMLPEVSTPPPVCGGCLPVGALESRTFHLPAMSAPLRCRTSAVSLSITNTGDEPLSVQGFFTPSTADPSCEDTWFPVQVNGLMPGATLNLDGVNGRFSAMYGGLKRRPIGVVGTPTGGPWRPATLDRYQSWDFVVQSAAGAQFDTVIALHDREA
jgi:hypothetical protein